MIRGDHDWITRNEKSTVAYIRVYSAAERLLSTAGDMTLVTQWSTPSPPHFVILIQAGDFYLSIIYLPIYLSIYPFILTIYLIVSYLCQFTKDTSE